jgi:hypothetical protein
MLSEELKNISINSNLHDIKQYIYEGLIADMKGMAACGLYSYRIFEDNQFTYGLDRPTSRKYIIDRLTQDGFLVESGKSGPWVFGLKYLEISWKVVTDHVMSPFLTSPIKVDGL